VRDSIKWLFLEMTKMKDDEDLKLQAHNQAYKKESALRKSIESLLGKTPLPRLFIRPLLYFIFVMNCSSQYP
jgi:hypothetical protein